MINEESMKRINFVFLLSVFSMNFTIGQEKMDEASILIQLDREFDKATAEKGIDGWLAYFAPNGSMVGDTSKPIIGPAEVRKAMEPLFSDSTFSLRWKPTKSEMLLPGILGYTVGQFIRLKNVTGKMMRWTGSYSTLWMKQPDGSWKVVFDTGNTDGPPVEVNESPVR